MDAKQALAFLEFVIKENLEVKYKIFADVDKALALLAEALKEKTDL